MNLPQRYRLWIPYIILVGMIMITLLFSYYTAVTTEVRDRLRFQNTVQRTQNTIENRLQTHITLLYAAKGLFAADEQVTREDFRVFIEQLQLPERYPGLQGIGFSVRLLPDEIDTLTAALQQQGIEDFSIRPVFSRPEYHSIIYLEPFDRRNQAAIGYDMFTEAVRRAAMERARDTGEAAASGRVILVQEIDADRQAGFLIYVPIYRTGQPTNTVAERRAALQGFVYSPFRADDLLAGIFRNTYQRQVDLEVYDGTEHLPERLLHRSNTNDPATLFHTPRFTTAQTLDVAGQTWSLVFSSRPEFEATFEGNRVPYILVGGLLLSAILFAILRSQGRARLAAEQIAVYLQRSEAALRERESRLRCLVDANIIGITIINTQGQILEANDAFLNLVGYTRQEIQSGQIQWTALTPLKYRDLDEQAMQEIRQQGSHMPYEKEYIHKDGRCVPVFVGTAALDELGLGVGFIIDLTEQKRAEAAVQQSEIRFRTLIEQSPLSIQIFAPDGHVLRVNRAWENLWGIRFEQLVQIHYNILQDEQLAAKGLMPYIQKGFAGQSTVLPAVLYEPNLSLTDGHRHQHHHLARWIQAYIYPVRNEAGSIREVVVLQEDITERKLAEEALQSSNERLSLLYSTSSSLLLYDQPDTFITGLFRQLSEHLQLEIYLNYLFDRNQQKLRLQSYQGLPTDVAQQLEWIEMGQAVCGTVAQRKVPMVVEQVQMQTDPIACLIQSLGVTAYASYPLLSRGQLIGTLSFGTCNRTHFNKDELALLQVVAEQVATALERSRLITELQQQTEELAQANQAKDEFLATLSHELRTPLNAMLGWTQLLRTRQFDENTTARALETIDRNTRSLAQLIEDILDVSRIITGKLHLNWSIVALVTVIESAIETIQPTADQKKIRIETQLDPNIGTIMGDSHRLQQIIWNLLSNAIKFTPENGLVRVTLEKIEKVLDPQQESEAQEEALQTSNRSYVRISVTDTGRGIRSEFLPQVFDRFRQADSSSTRAHGGLGLGLSIVRHLVELQGGHVYATSPGEGQGATFSIEFPLQPVKNSLKELWSNLSQDSAQLDPVPGEAIRQSQLLQGISVLIVEDEADTRELIATILKQSGAKVISVATAQHALQALPEVNPDVLVSDIGMPEMNGYDLIQQIRSLPTEQDRNIPAIALTAYASELDQRQSLAAGFQRHLAKPIEPETLIETIAEIFQHVSLP